VYNTVGRKQVHLQQPIVITVADVRCAAFDCFVRISMVKGSARLLRLHGFCSDTVRPPLTQEMVSMGTVKQIFLFTDQESLNEYNSTVIGIGLASGHMRVLRQSQFVKWAAG